jgi:ABC-type glycerol-3-phosphate transport system permease component
MHCSDRKEDKIMVGKQERRYQRMITVVLALISLIMVIPLVLLVVASFTSNNEIVLHGYSFFPKELSLEAYRYIWNHHSGNRDWNNDWRDDDTFVCVCTGT